MARPGRLELPTLCLEGRRSFQLSYGRVYWPHSITALGASSRSRFQSYLECAHFCAGQSPLVGAGCNSLCRGKQRRTMQKLEVQIANSGSVRLGERPRRNSSQDERGHMETAISDLV